MILKGIDVNARAIALARSKRLPITFEVADANDWAEGRRQLGCRIDNVSARPIFPTKVPKPLPNTFPESASAMISVEPMGRHARH